MTDSAGVTEEIAVMGVPRMTPCDGAERLETVSMGTNEGLGSHQTSLNPALDRLFRGAWKKGSVPFLWDGALASRTVSRSARLL